MLYSNPKCYAQEQQNCSPEISKEHFISKAILSKLGSTLTLFGTPHRPPNIPLITSPANLASNILCKRHNSLLSKLDATALDLFNVLEKFTNRSKETPNQTITGQHLETWFLKVLCGLLASSNVRSKFGYPLKNTKLPKKWVDILFTHKNFPERAGLYCFLPKNPPIDPIHITIKTRGAGNPYGISMILFGLGFHVSTVPVNLKETPGDVVNIWYRPRGFKFDTGEVIIDWGDLKVKDQIIQITN